MKNKHIQLTADSLLRRNSWTEHTDGKHADDHRRGRGWRPADLDAHYHHHRHLPPQTQEQETGEGAD